MHPVKTTVDLPTSCNPFLLAAGVRAAAFTLFSLTVAVGCASHPTDQQIQQQAAQTTQQVKQEAKEAAADARVAAATATEKLNAVAAGIKEGWQNGAPAHPVDLNTGSRNQLLGLPGISPTKARKIIANRPYATPQDLVSKNVLTQPQLDRIASHVKVQ